jgi:single-strand DNA-binding protein
LPEPPPPELLEQLGIDPHCRCDARGRHRDEGWPARRRAAAPQSQTTATPVKENPMRDIATATLSGNLTCDVELRDLPSGTEVARLRVATTTRRRNGEDWVDKTNYFTVEVYGARARACAEYLGKGSRVVVDAELDWREWTDQQDKRREAVTLRARQVLFEGTRPSTNDGDQGGEHDGSSHRSAESVEASAPGDESASAADLPF